MTNGVRVSEKQRQVTDKTYEWECPGCGAEMKETVYPAKSSGGLYCYHCRQQETAREEAAKQDRYWRAWLKEYPALRGAKLVAADFRWEGTVLGLVLEATDGSRWRVEIDRGWEAGDRELEFTQLVGKI